jgi:hypothetical protein
LVLAACSEIARNGMFKDVSVPAIHKGIVGDDWDLSSHGGKSG